MQTKEKLICAVALGATAAAVATGAIAGSVANAGTIPACMPSQLDVRTIARDAGMHHKEITYQITNHSDNECLVHDAPTAVKQTNGAPTTTTLGNTYFSENGPALTIPLKHGWSSEGKIGWAINPNEPLPDPEGSGYDLVIELPDVGEVPVQYHDTTGAYEGQYVVTNLTDGPK